MGRRILRLRANDIPQGLEQIPIGSELNVVLADNTTFHGYLEAIQETALVMKDVNAAWYNRKAHTHELPFSTIQEIHLDRITKF